MIELKANALEFSFPKVHPQARLSVRFMRTLRIPDDGRNYALPPGMGLFPMQHVEDFGDRVPGGWSRHGGVMLPMYQSEAMWVSFTPNRVPERSTAYPFAVQIAAGKINAVTGEPYRNELSSNPQSYVVSPQQPWLDGYVVEKDFIRQFVAMPLGDGYSPEEQITGAAEFGGLQIMIYPMKSERFEARFPIQPMRPSVQHFTDVPRPMSASPRSSARPDMALGAGGRMRQQVYTDPYSFTDWDASTGHRCFVHLTNSLVWQDITGEKPPTIPPTAKTYEEAGLPWFDYYRDDSALNAQEALSRVRSITEVAAKTGQNPLPENSSFEPKNIIQLGAQYNPDVVRDGEF